MDVQCVVSHWMLVSRLSVSVNPHEMLWVVDAWTFLCRVLKADDLSSLFLLIWVFKKLNLS